MARHDPESDTVPQNDNSQADHAGSEQAQGAGPTLNPPGRATTLLSSLRSGDGGALDPEYETAHREVMGHDIDAEQHQDHEINGPGAQEEDATMARRLQEQKCGATRLGDRTEHGHPEDSDVETEAESEADEADSSTERPSPTPYSENRGRRLVRVRPDPVPYDQNTERRWTWTRAPSNAPNEQPPSDSDPDEDLIKRQGRHYREHRILDVKDAKKDAHNKRKERQKAARSQRRADASRDREADAARERPTPRKKKGKNPKGAIEVSSDED